jgi:hypothetical protein
MNGVFHRPCEFFISPTQADGNPNLFDIGIRYRPEGDMQWFPHTFVPTSLQNPLLQGEIEGVHLEVLEASGSACHRLPGAPLVMLIAVELKSGTRYSEVPRELIWMRRRYAAMGLFACALGLVVLTAHPWFGATFLVAGTHSLRSVRRLNFRPFYVGTQHKG